MTLYECWNCKASIAKGLMYILLGSMAAFALLNYDLGPLWTWIDRFFLE